MADESRDPMVEHLLELRRQQTAAHGLAKYLDQQVRTREEILILSGIPVPPPEEGGSRQSGGVQEGAAAPVVEEAALSRETGTGKNPPDAGTEETPASARLIRCRLDKLRQIPEARQTTEQREEERLLERISACSHQRGMLKVIAKNFGNRILLTDATILIFNSGRSIVHPRTLAGQLRNNIVNKDPDHWKILDKSGDKNDVQFFPDGDAVQGEGELAPGNPNPVGSANSNPRDGNNGTGMMLMETRIEGRGE